MNEREWALRRRLSIFTGPFTLESAIAVAGGRDDSHVIAALEQLVAKSLLTVRPEGTSTHYRPLNITRAYATQKLVDSGEAGDVACRHARYIRDVLERALRESTGDSQISRTPQRGAAGRRDVLHCALLGRIHLWLGRGLADG